MFCKNCGAAIEKGQTSCPVCGTAVPSESERSVSAQYAYPPATALPMKWYKFLINFALFFSVVLNAISGVQLIIGDQYRDGNVDMSGLVYSQFGALKTVDVVAGIVMIAFALFTLYVRSRLAGYCKNGPKMLL
ncbi:MAG: zinc ribbon domain-containing protein, partial [Oscillospiraceae bacterium]|nr:zinc ribbon domain-containing protein [Oscillospiraceae bacterium]